MDVNLCALTGDRREPLRGGWKLFGKLFAQGCALDSRPTKRWACVGDIWRFLEIFGVPFHIWLPWLLLPEDPWDTEVRVAVEVAEWLVILIFGKWKLRQFGETLRKSRQIKENGWKDETLKTRNNQGTLYNGPVQWPMNFLRHFWYGELAIAHFLIWDNSWWFCGFWTKLKMGHGVLCGSVETTRDISQWLTWPRPENIRHRLGKRFTHERSLTESFGTKSYEEWSSKDIG